MMKKETSVDVHETFTCTKKISLLVCSVFLLKDDEGSQSDLILFVYSNQVQGKFSHRLHFNRPYYELLLSSPFNFVGIINPQISSGIFLILFHFLKTGKDLVKFQGVIIFDFL